MVTKKTYADNEGYDLGANIPTGEPALSGNVGLGVGASGNIGITLPTPPKPTSSGGGGSTQPVTPAEVAAEEVAPAEEPYVTPDYGRVPEPSFGSIKLSGIKVDEAPAYEKTPEQIAWEQAHGGRIEDILQKGGLGIDEETQQLMKQQQFDILKAREKENLRLMEADMIRRGITSSLLWFSEEQKIKATTTRSLAASMTEISIKSAFMKMASFENALGLSAQYLGYLSEQSQLAYAPKLATWQAKQQAKIVAYQAKVEVYKMKLNQAYTQNNMSYAAEIAADVAHQQNVWDVEMAVMEMENNAEIAKAQGAGNLLGTIIGGVTSLFV